MTFFLLYWKQIALAVAFGLLAAYAGLQRVEKDAIRAEYAEYRTKVAEAARAAAAAALQRTIADEKRKEEADEENLRLRTALAATTRKLRDARAASSFVPPSAPGASRPEVAAFDRAELERALRELDQEIQGLIDEGDQAVIDLNTARNWARER